MRVILSLVTGAALLGVVVAAEAQQKTPKKEKQPATAEKTDKDGCFTRDERTDCVFSRFALDSALIKRPAIGVQLNPTGTPRDSIGVFVSSVTPDGPAEKAGIIEGDRIVAINAVELKVNSADAGDDYAAELPIRRLAREVGKLDPGAVATLRVWSGGRVRDVPVTVGRASDLAGFGPAALLDGVRGTRIMSMPMDEPGVRLREMPRMRVEEMQIPRLKLEGLRDRIRTERIEPLRDDARSRVSAPSRIRVFHDGEHAGNPDVIYEKKMSEIEKSEKATAGQKKSGKKK